MSSVLSDDAAPAELGRNTEAAMTSGLYWGHVGAVKELMRRLMHVEEAHHHPLLLLTGGAAPLLHLHLPTIVRYEPHLALQGLALVATTSCEAAGR
jgi:type III pantothenate kinase